MPSLIADDSDPNATAPNDASTPSDDAMPAAGSNDAHLLLGLNAPRAATEQAVNMRAGLASRERLSVCYQIVDMLHTISRQCLHICGQPDYTHVSDTAFNQPGGPPYSFYAPQRAWSDHALWLPGCGGPSELVPGNAANALGTPANAADSRPLSTPPNAGDLFAAAPTLATDGQSSAPKLARLQPLKRRMKKNIGGQGLNSYNLFKSYAKHCYVRGDKRLPLIEYARLCVQGQKEHKRNTMSSAVKGDSSTRLKRVSEKLRHDWEALAPHLKQEYKRACAIALEERSRAL
jgi:hypothetical protein